MRALLEAVSALEHDAHLEELALRCGTLAALVCHPAATTEAQPSALPTMRGCPEALAVAALLRAHAQAVAAAAAPPHPPPPRLALALAGAALVESFARLHAACAADAAFDGGDGDGAAAGRVSDLLEGARRSAEEAARHLAGVADADADAAAVGEAAEEVGEAAAAAAAVAALVGARPSPTAARASPTGAEAAAATLARACERWPASAALHARLGVARAANSQPEAAHAAFEHALALGGDAHGRRGALSLHNLAVLYEGARQPLAAYNVAKFLREHLAAAPAEAPTPLLACWRDDDGGGGGGGGGRAARRRLRRPQPARRRVRARARGAPRGRRGARRGGGGAEGTARLGAARARRTRRPRRRRRVGRRRRPAARAAGPRDAFG